MTKIHEIADPMSFPDYGDIEFHGTPRDIAVQFLHAAWALRVKVDSGGAAGIDFERMAEVPGSSTPNYQPDAAYAVAVDRLRALEAITRRAFADVNPRDVCLWTWTRAPMRQITDADTGAAWWTTCSAGEAGQLLADEGFAPLGRTRVNEIAADLDARLDAELRLVGWRL